MPIPQLPLKNNSDWREQKRRHLSERHHYIPEVKKNNEPSNHQRERNKSQGGGKTLSRFRKKLFRFFLALIFLGSIVGGIILLILFFRISLSLPDPNTLIERDVAQSTQIYDRSGKNLLYEVHGDQKRTLVSLDQIPKQVKNATIAIEDKNFYEHKGFSAWAIFRSLITNILYGQKSGGSTLTQQLIKNAILTNEKTYTRKIKELILAYRVEQKFSKDQILQLYLNEIPYGSTAYGVEAASQRFFGKKIQEVNLAEAAILAAIPQAPSRYSPYGPNRQTLIDRQHYILDLMAEQKYTTKEESEEAKNFELKFKEPREQMTAPHFVMYVKDYLSSKYGEKLIEEGGWKIYTTLDLYKQKIAEEIITDQAPKIATQYGASNAALLSIDPKTGQILVMVGSKDYWSSEIDGQVNLTTSLRQPGSSIKPLVYAAAFEKGYNPNTLLYDVNTNFNTDKDGEPYMPKNYDGQERGPVLMRSALAGSLNIPAVQTIYLAGLDNVLRLAKDLGYTTLNDKDRYGLSLVLGGGEVKMIEHTNAFSAFAREGRILPITPILKIEDKDGHLIEQFQLERSKQVMDPKIARYINDILSDNNARASVFGQSNYLTLGKRPVAAKTGTTNDYRDAWTIGYTPSLVTTVWTGNNDNSKMKNKADGSQVAAPIWRDYMQKVLGETPIENFKKEEIATSSQSILNGFDPGVEIVKIDKFSGLLATELTPVSSTEERVFYNPHSILYFINKDNPLGQAPEHPENDPQFENWEKSVALWAQATSTIEKLKKDKFAGKEITFGPPPTEKDNVHLLENQPVFQIESPQQDQILNSNLITVILSQLSAPRGIKKADYFIDNHLIASVLDYPFNLSKLLENLTPVPHVLKVKICDDVENCTEKSLNFTLTL